MASKALKIVQAGHPVLREPTVEVTDINADVRQAARRMELAMRASRGLGVAANQIRYRYRMFVYLDGTKSVTVINPVVVDKSDILVEDSERCLSIPGKEFYIPRPKSLTISCIDLAGNERVIEGTDIVARCFAHEIDHLNGVLISDYLGDGNDTLPIGERST